MHPRRIRNKLFENPKEPEIKDWFTKLDKKTHRDFVYEFATDFDLSFRQVDNMLNIRGLLPAMKKWIRDWADKHNIPIPEEKNTEAEIVKS